MADPLLAVNMGDLVATTQRNLGKPKFTEIATDIQEFTALPNLLKKNRVVFQSGYGIQWDVMVNHAQSARNVGLGAQDNPTLIDTMVQATADWRNSDAHYTFIAQEIDMNREPQRIVDLLKARRIAAMISLTELMENNFWGPPVAADDNITPWGVNMWITKNATKGFNGGAPTGYDTIGLNPTTYPRWRNWTELYTALTKTDFVRKVREACTKTNFKPPVKGIPDFNTGDMYGHYTNYNVIAPLEEILEQQNDNLGADIAKYDGMVTFRRRPVVWVPLLDNDTTNPFYGINWGVFKTIILQGWWLKELNVPHYPGQHNVNVTFMDITYNTVCYNRRRNYVLATGTTYPG